MKQCCWLKLTRPSSCLAIPFSVRPTDWLQHCSHAGQRTDKQQHGECDYQKKCCPHVVQNGDHGTSLFLLDSLTAPSTFTDPRTHRVHLLKRSSTTGTLSRPGKPLLLFKVYRSNRHLFSISAQPLHGITSFMRRVIVNNTPSQIYPALAEWLMESSKLLNHWKCMEISALA